MNFDQVTQTEIVIIFIFLFVSACKVVPPVNWSALVPNKGNSLSYYLKAFINFRPVLKWIKEWILNVNHPGFCYICLLGLRVLFLIRHIYTADGAPDRCIFYSKHRLFPFKL